MKKILIIHNILWSHYKARVFSELHNILEADKYQLLVVHIATKGIAQQNFGLIDKADHKYPFKLLFDTDYEKTNSIKRIITLLREIISYNPDIMILPGYSDISYWFALFVAKLLRLPTMVTVDSTATDRPRVRWKELLKKLFILGVDAAFCYGQKSKEYLLQLGMPEKRIFIRRQATNNDEIMAINRKAMGRRQSQLDKLSLKPHNFVYVGRLSPEKNVEKLIRAFHVLKKTISSSVGWGLIVVGDGPQREELVKLCADLKIEDVYLFGGKSWREIPEYYAMADVFVLPSTSEPWGLVVNEAMLCNLPVLVSERCGAAADLVEHGKNGFIFNPFSIEELIDYMTKFVTSDVERIKMGKRSGEIIRDYSPENAASQMLNGIDNVLRKTKS